MRAAAAAACSFCSRWSCCGVVARAPPQVIEFVPHMRSIQSWFHVHFAPSATFGVNVRVQEVGAV